MSNRTANLGFFSDTICESIANAFASGLQIILTANYAPDSSPESGYAYTLAGYNAHTQTLTLYQPWEVEGISS